MQDTVNMGTLIVYTISAFILCIGTCTCQCPDAWMQFKGSCYLFSREDKTFTEAEHFCIQHQSHLVKIDNSVEDNFLKSHSSDLKDAARWIGLTDADKEGVWKWTDGSLADYINWYPGEAIGPLAEAEDCVFLHSAVQYAWIDVSCARKFKPICEKAIAACTCQPDGGALIG